MTRKMTTTAGGLDIEDGTYRVKLLALEDAEGEWQGQKRKLLKWCWRLPDVPNEEGDPTETSDLTSLILGPKSNLWARYEALMGVTLEVGVEIDLEGMVGKEAQASFAHKTPKGEPSTFSRIQDVMGLPKIGPKVKAPTIDQFEGFHQEDGEVNWDNFAGRCSTEGITGLEVAKFMGVPKASGPAIRKWIEADASRSLLGLIEQVKHEKAPPAVDPDELPFE